MTTEMRTAAMTKKMKKSKRRMNLLAISFILFLLASFTYFGCSLFVRSHNNRLSTQIQEISSEISTLETENDAVKVDIQTLSNRDRIDVITSQDGMTSSAGSSVITITAADDSAEEN